MANVYDPEKTDEDKIISPEQAREMEDLYKKDTPSGSAPHDDIDNPGDLAKTEKEAAGSSHDNTVGDGYKPSITAGGRFRFTKKKAAGGAGIVGIIISLFFMFSLTGPFQFIHFSQLLQQFHFASLEDQTDVRAFRLIRFIKSGGDVREARVGIIARRMAVRMEARFLDAGFKYLPDGPSKYFGGFEIDRNNPKFKGRSDADIRKELAGKNIPTEVRGRQIVVLGNEKYRTSSPTIRAMMREVGYSKISSAIQSRTVAGKWFGFARWHPMRKAEARGNQALAPYWEAFKKKFNERVGRGSFGVGGTGTGEIKERLVCPNPCSPEQQAEIDRQNADIDRHNAEMNRQIEEQNRHIRDTDQDGRDVNAEDQRERADKAREKRARLTARAKVGGAAGAMVVTCVANDFNNQYEAIKQYQIVIPLIRGALEFTALGNQVMNGEDADLDQLGAYNEYFDDPKTGSWANAPDIKAELGETSTRPLNEDQLDQKNNLDHIGKASPFKGFIDSIPGGKPVVDKACGPIGFVVGVVLAIPLLLTGPPGWAVFAGTLIAGEAFQRVAMPLLVSWLGGVAVDAYAEGAIFGTNMNYGTLLAANSMNVSRGGRELLDPDVQEVDAITRAGINQEFASKSFAQRLFDPYDPKSAIAKLLDVPDPEVTANIAKMSNSLFNVGKMLSSLPNIFANTARAAPALPYAYGFPEFGFAADEIDNDAAYNPYENARQVLNMLPSRGDLVERARQCFGVNIGPDSGGALGVTHVGEAEAPNPYNETDGIYTTGECNDPSTEWLRIRMFIYDTTTMDAISCFEEDDEQSCTRVGFGPSTASGGSGGPVDCNAQTGIDQSPGEPPAQFRDLIIANAGGLTCPDYPKPNGAVPSDPGKQYFAFDGCSDECADQGENGEANCAGEKKCIKVQYRDPPGSGNSLFLCYEGCGGGGGNPPPGPEPVCPPNIPRALCLAQ